MKGTKKGIYISNNPKKTKNMTFKEFEKRYEWLAYTYSEFDFIGSGKKQIELCRRFFVENRSTMNDLELAQMLYQYVQCLNGYPDDNAELGKIVILREKVCRRLAKQSFEDYGEEWACAMYDKAFHGQMPDSLADYNASMAILERLINEFGHECELMLAHYCYHAAVDCDYHELFGNALEYIERALGIYQKEGNLTRYDILTLGLCQKIAANALTKLGRYDEAEERLEKAEEILLEWSSMHENAGRTVTRNYFMGECDDIRDEIRKHRENEGKNTTQKSTT